MPVTDDVSVAEADFSLLVISTSFCGIFIHFKTVTSSHLSYRCQELEVGTMQKNNFSQGRRNAVSTSMYVFHGENVTGKGGLGRKESQSPLC